MDRVTKINKLKNKIVVLKSNLSKTDYQAIKYAEGALTFEEYAETMQKRRDWRTEINSAESEIKMLGG